MATDVTTLLNQAAAKYGIDPSLLTAIAQKESALNPTAVSSAGAQGVMQLMPATAASLGVSNPFDPAQNIDAGARYFSQLLNQFGGNTSLALAAYNAGPGAVTKYGGIPPYTQTQDYVTSVLAAAGLPADSTTAPADTGAIGAADSTAGMLSAGILPTDGLSMAAVIALAVAAVLLIFVVSGE